VPVVVVGIRISRNPRWAIAVAKPDSIQNRAASDDNHIAATVHVSFVENLQHPFEDMDVVLHGFAAGYHLRIANHLKTPAYFRRKRMQSLAQIRVGSCDMFIQPELNSGDPRFGRLKQIRKTVRIDTKHIIGKSQAMAEGDLEVNVSGDICGLDWSPFGFVVSWEIGNS
jgi:hypothetical protein